MAALDAARKAAEVLKEVSEGIGVPWLKAGVGTVLIVLNMAKKARTNAEDVRTLTQRLSELTAMIMNAPVLKDPASLPPALQDAITQLTRSWERIGSDAKALSDRSRLKRWWASEDDAEKIQDFIFRLRLSLQSFMTESTARIEAALHHHSLNMNERLDAVQHHIQETSARLQDDRERDEQNFEEVKERLEKLKMSDADDLGALPYAKAARYDASNARNRCLEGTRAGVLEEIEGWIARRTADDVDSIGPSTGPRQAGQPTSRADARIFWLNGIAGTGKTTIAYTVAERCHTSGILAGCFFCSRSDADCNDVQKIWTTVAYQIALRFPAFKLRMVEALRNDPHIIYAHAPTQLRTLIIDILTAVKADLVDCIVVIDALDECRDPEAIASIISMLVQCAEQLSPIRFFLTSRPEAHIRGVFDSRGDPTISTRFLLHEVQLEVVNLDLERFIAAKLHEIRASGRYILPYPWPTRNQIKRLALNTHGLFIYAHTCILFVADRNFSDPVGQLDALISSNSGTASSFTQLDQLYLQVLSSAFPNISSLLSEKLRTVLGAIITLNEPLPLADLAALLRLEPVRIQNWLSNLHSVLIFPDTSSGLAIRIIHPTFAEFIVDTARCTNPAFLVEPKQAHALLLHGCLTAMLVTLKRDVCDCRFWVAHLENIQVLEDPDVRALLRVFVSEKLLYWMEACSLLGILRDALLALKAAERLLKGFDGRSDDEGDLVELLHDGGRLLTQSFRTISSSCLHVYFSALPMCPTESLLRRVFTRELTCTPSPPKTVCRAPQMWDRRLGGFLAHRDGVRVAELSPDGAVLASGGRDNMVHLFDASSFIHLQTLGRDLRDITHLKFSPGGRILACLSDVPVGEYTSTGTFMQVLGTARFSQRRFY